MFNKFIILLRVYFFILITLLVFQKNSSAEDLLEINAENGRLVQAAMYPIYVVFLKDGDIKNQKADWVDKSYWASLDMLEGKFKNKSILFKLHTSSEASPQPEWCKSSSGEKYEGRGITCLKDESLKEELRFKLNIQWASDAPEAFSNRSFIEHPNVPGGIGGGQGDLGSVKFVIYKN